MDANRVVGSTFVVLFTLVIAYLFNGLFVAILIDGFEQVSIKTKKS